MPTETTTTKSKISTQRRIIFTMNNAVQVEQYYVQDYNANEDMN